MPAPPAHILVVEDEGDILELIRYSLEKEGYTVSCATSGETALAAIRELPPDLIILDLMLPGLDGLQVCRLVKADPETRSIPVIVVTARGTERDMVAGLNLGADDYIPKPFSTAVLIARVASALRRGGEPEVDQDDAAPLSVGGIAIHPGRHEVIANGTPVRLTRTEFAILRVLARRPGWVLNREQIVTAAQGPSYVVSERAVDVQIVSLRKKLGPSGRLIETVRGVGYRMRG